jgi:hypothetical protein
MLVLAGVALLRIPKSARTSRPPTDERAYDVQVGDLVEIESAKKPGARSLSVWRADDMQSMDIETPVTAKVTRAEGMSAPGYEPFTREVEILEGRHRGLKVFAGRYAVRFLSRTPPAIAAKRPSQSNGKPAVSSVPVKPAKRWYPQESEVVQLHCPGLPPEGQIAVTMCLRLEAWDLVRKADVDLRRGGEGATIQMNRLIQDGDACLILLPARGRVLTPPPESARDLPCSIAVVDGEMKGSVGLVRVDDLAPLQADQTPLLPSPKEARR